MHENSAANRRIHTFAEQDYRFGAGPLRLAVERIEWNTPVRYEDEDWYEVAGIEVAADGRVIGRRRAQVRGSRLQHHRSA